MPTYSIYYDDYNLLAGIANGDEVAFNKLFTRYRQKLYLYMLKITKSPEIAEEIVMDVFVKLWIGRELLPNIRQLEGFLHKVAYHKAMDFLRTASRQAKLRQVYVERMEGTPEKCADELMMDAEIRALLRKAIHSLPPKRKLIYTLSREEGLTHDQIAAALNLSPNTVKNSITAATKAIGDFLRSSQAGKAAFTFLWVVGVLSA